MYFDRAVCQGVASESLCIFVGFLCSLVYLPALYKRHAGERSSEGDGGDRGGNDCGVFVPDGFGVSGIPAYDV